MPWRRNPLRDTKDKGTNSSSGSSEANWAKAEVFNLPLLLLLRHLLLDTVGQRTLDTCTACWTLPTHTHFQGRGRFWHGSHVTALSVTLSRGSISSAAGQELLSQRGAAGTETFPAQQFMHRVLQLLLSHCSLLLASMQMCSPTTHIWQVYYIWKSRLKAGTRQNQTIHA